MNKFSFSLYYLLVVIDNRQELKYGRDALKTKKLRFMYNIGLKKINQL